MAAKALNDYLSPGNMFISLTPLKVRIPSRVISTHHLAWRWILLSIH